MGCSLEIVFHQGPNPLLKIKLRLAVNIPFGNWILWNMPGRNPSVSSDIRKRRNCSYVPTVTQKANSTNLKVVQLITQSFQFTKSTLDLGGGGVRGDHGCIDSSSNDKPQLPTVPNDDLIFAHLLHRIETHRHLGVETKIRWVGMAFLSICLSVYCIH